LPLGISSFSQATKSTLTWTSTAALQPRSLTARSPGGFLYGDSKRVCLNTAGASLTKRARRELDAWARAERLEISDR
jgi:hypothetical protein